MTGKIYEVNGDGDSLKFRGTLLRPPKGNVKTAFFKWMETYGVEGGKYIVLAQLTEVYEAKKEESLTFEVEDE